MKIRFGFSTSDWIVSRAIRFFTRARVSHAFLLLEGVTLIEGEPPIDLVLEAGWDGWRLSTKAKLTSGSTRIVALVDPPLDLVIPVHAATMKSLADLGERYDYGGLFGMAWVCIGRWLGKKWRNPWRSADSMFCSDAIVKEILQPVGWLGASFLDAQSIDPETLAEFLGADLS